MTASRCCTSVDPRKLDVGPLSDPHTSLMAERLLSLTATRKERTADSGLEVAALPLCWPPQAPATASISASPAPRTRCGTESLTMKFNGSNLYGSETRGKRADAPLCER